MTTCTHDTLTRQGGFLLHDGSEEGPKRLQSLYACECGDFVWIDDDQFREGGGQ